MTLLHPLGDREKGVSSGVRDHVRKHSTDQTQRWQNFNAVDIPTRSGTPVYAVADGTIGRPGPGALQSGNPDMAGIRLHLETPSDTYYYAHLSKLAKGIHAGIAVKRGTLLGLSGRAGGVDHLHFAAQHANPDSLIAQSDSLPDPIEESIPVGDELNDVVPLIGFSDRSEPRSESDPLDPGAQIDDYVSNSNGFGPVPDADGNPQTNLLSAPMDPGAAGFDLNAAQFHDAHSLPAASPAADPLDPGSQVNDFAEGLASAPSDNSFHAGDMIFDLVGVSDSVDVVSAIPDTGIQTSDSGDNVFDPGGHMPEGGADTPVIEANLVENGTPIPPELEGDGS